MPLKRYKNVYCKIYLIKLKSDILRDQLIYKYFSFGKNNIPVFFKT